MKVVVITNYWKNSDGGGLKKYIVNLVEELENRGLDIHIIFRLGSDESRKKGSKYSLLFVIDSFFYLKKMKPEIIQSFGGNWYCLLPAAIYKRIYPCKVVGAFHTEPDRKFSFIETTILQLLINECDCVTFGSKRLVQIMEETQGIKFRKMEITPAGIRSVDISENQILGFRQNFKIRDDAIIFLALGLTALKHKAEGAKLLISAIKIARVKYPAILLILTREGKFSAELKQYAISEGVLENVLFTGDIDDPNSAMSTAQYYIHTPLGEGGVPQSLLEAMIMGKPIIATSVGGIPEAIDNGIDGILVDPDSDKIAESILLLLDNHELAQNLGKNAKMKAGRNFSWGALADKFIRIYSN